MSSQRHWLQHYATLLIERERSLASWHELAIAVIPRRRLRSFQTLTKEIWQASEPLPFLEKQRLITLFCSNERFVNWWTKGPCPLPAALSIGELAPRMDTSSWSLPALPDLATLADFLHLHPDDLGWLTSPQHHHYHEQWLAKRRGGRRLLESPKPLLKQAQRTLLESLLNKIPPHEAATGFRQGHSIIDFAAPHIAKETVLKMDLADFFPSISRPRIKRTFMALGYREDIALALASLTTSRSRRADQTSAEASLYQRGHLPQGAPTSPALANLAAFRLDCRLAGLAQKSRVSYTRYADDLLFSGNAPFSRQAPRFQITVMAIALEEGLTINARKTRTMPNSQRQAAAGLILNQKLNARRTDYHQLKAILHNCHKHGPASQNHQGHPQFAAHLRGRIAWLASLNPTWGEKLQSSYHAITWES